MTAEASSQRTTIGLTPEGIVALESLMSSGWFSTKGDAFKFALAYALAAGIEPTSGSAPFSTIWNRGTLDPDDKLYSMVSLLSPSDDVWDRVRRLGDAGIRSLVEQNLHIGFPSEVLESVRDR